jgi:hypothetical protein
MLRPGRHGWTTRFDSAATTTTSSTTSSLPPLRSTKAPANDATEDTEQEKTADTGGYADDKRFVLIDPGTHFLED